MEQDQNCCNQENITLEENKLIEQDSGELEIQWYVDKETNSKNRFDICQGCDQLVPIVNVCKQCGCLMKIKTRIYSAICPLNKW